MSGSTPKYRLTWQLAILASDLPTTTRYLLLALSVRMKWNQVSCYPSLDQLERDTRLARSTICEHLTAATNADWLIVEKRSGKGQRWRRNLYRASVPIKSNDEGTSGSPVEPLETPDVVREPTEGSSRDSRKVVRQSVSNESHNESLNSAGAGARDREAAPAPAEQRHPKPATAIAAPSVAFEDVRAWAEARRGIANHVGEATFRSWIAPIRLEATSPAFVLSAPSRFHRDHVISHFLVHLRDRLSAAFGEDREIEWRLRREYTHGPASTPSTDDDCGRT